MRGLRTQLRTRSGLEKPLMIFNATRAHLQLPASKKWIEMDVWNNFSCAIKDIDSHRGPKLSISSTTHLCRSRNRWRAFLENSVNVQWSRRFQDDSVLVRECNFSCPKPYNLQVDVGTRKRCIVWPCHLKGWACRSRILPESHMDRRLAEAIYKLRSLCQIIVSL